MKREGFRVWVVLLALCPLQAAHAALSAQAQVEINRLLEAVATSGCEFNRNGAWYDARHAEAHLRYKYKRLVAWNLIDNAEEFIDRGASTSSISGRAYLVRCSGHPTVTSSEWLRDQLALERARDEQAPLGP
jgi:hypothetical protein